MQEYGKMWGYFLCNQLRKLCWNRFGFVCRFTQCGFTDDCEYTQSTSRVLNL